MAIVKPLKFYVAGTVNDFGHARWVVVRRRPFAHLAECRHRHHADVIVAELNHRAATKPRDAKRAVTTVGAKRKKHTRKLT